MNRPVLTFGIIIIIKFSLPLAFCIARLRSNFLFSLEYSLLSLAQFLSLSLSIIMIIKQLRN